MEVAQILFSESLLLERLIVFFRNKIEHPSDKREGCQERTVGFLKIFFLPICSCLMLRKGQWIKIHY